MNQLHPLSIKQTAIKSREALHSDLEARCGSTLGWFGVKAESGFFQLCLLNGKIAKLKLPSLKANFDPESLPLERKECRKVPALYVDFCVRVPAIAAKIDTYRAD
uniref:Uncharacterized protein n=1 Tax=Desertifilum tharense IPPAS B-1220 TaxID=1781255 RepID=A0A1E5QGW6_9CYAN|nr:hypothetical protein BH720_17155 [Desertifilum tharense IPPAS B-1220]